MNIKEYIESGIIELYVMNALPENEKAEVEAMARQHPDIQAEIDEVQAIMQVYSQAHAVNPSPELKDKILEKFKAETPPPTQNPKPKTQSDIEHPTSNIKKPPLSISTLLSGLVALLLGSLIFHFYQQTQTLKKEKEACEQEQNTQKLKNQKEIADLGYKLDILKSPDTRVVPMLVTDKKSVSGFKATVYWNVKEKATLLTIQNLPKPSEDKQYQLWAIVNGKPVDAGVFNYSLTEIQTMKPFENVGAFAVTLEPQGGSAKPTLENMQVLGAL
jgi:anti-sigma-K factor RskA